MKLTLVAGARPNFMKIAPLIRAIEKSNLVTRQIEYRLIHTGQHYDDALSLSFFRDLNIPQPHNNLGAGSGSQAEQTGAIMVAFEKELIAQRPDLVLVVGDVNSTLACSVVAKKLCVDVAHVEAGIRSGDKTMPEEINRLVTDAISDYFFTTTPEASQNLVNSGTPLNKIHFVGNTMIDCLLQNKDRFRHPDIFKTHSLKKKNYVVLTLHRPSNVDDPKKLDEIVRAITEGTGNIPIIFPVHPRTQKTLQQLSVSKTVIQTGPMPYLEFMSLIQLAKGVITDSGGIQEETTFLKIPCITLRNSTERPETVTQGTNELIGDSTEKITESIQKLLSGKWKTGEIPARWDGQTSERIVKELLHIYQ